MANWCDRIGTSHGHFIWWGLPAMANWCVRIGTSHVTRHALAPTQLPSLGDPKFLCDFFEFLQSPQGRGLSPGSMRGWFCCVRRILAFMPVAHPERSPAVSMTWHQLQEWLGGPVYRKALPRGTSKFSKRGRARTLRGLGEMWPRVCGAVDRFVKRTCKQVQEVILATTYMT